MAGVERFRLPDLGEGLTEGEILRWYVTVGEDVALNQPIVEVETAKAAVEIPAKWAGRVTAIFHDAGETVAVGTPIIEIDTAPAGAGGEAVTVRGGSAVGGGEAVTAVGGGEARTPVLVGYGPRVAGARRRPRPGRPAQATPRSAVVAGSAVVPGPVAGATTSGGGAAGSAVVPARTPAPPGAPVLAKPPVRKLARDLGVELRDVTGTGPHGSITRQDVLSARHAPVDGGAPAPAPVAGTRERRVPVRGVRRLIAENMVASAFTAPHATVFLTIDMTRALRALDRLRALPDWQELRVSPLLLVAKAALLAIGRHPMVNSTWAGDEIIVREYVNLGVAAATERGLIVPNVRDADRLTTRELARAMADLVATARAGRTTPEQMSGGTFTITNVGVFGIDTGTPILPPGEAAILALGAVRESPWVHKGKVVPRRVATLALSFDHRIVDGELAARFLGDVGAFLTDPATALLSWG